MGTYLPVLAASKTLAWLSAGLPDEYSSGHGRDSSTDLLQLDEMGWATWSIVALPPWPCYLPTLSASFQSPPSHSPSLPSDNFISFRLRALLRSPLRGLPISPGLKLFHSPVNPLSRSLDRDFMREHRYPRLCPRPQDHEGISFSLPGVGPHSLLQ